MMSDTEDHHHHPHRHNMNPESPNGVEETENFLGLKEDDGNISCCNEDRDIRDREEGEVVQGLKDEGEMEGRRCGAEEGGSSRIDMVEDKESLHEEIEIDGQSANGTSNMSRSSCGQLNFRVNEENENDIEDNNKTDKMERVDGNETSDCQAALNNDRGHGSKIIKDGDEESSEMLLAKFRRRPSPAGQDTKNSHTTLNERHFPQDHDFSNRYNVPILRPPGNDRNNNSNNGTSGSNNSTNAHCIPGPIGEDGSLNLSSFLRQQAAVIGAESARKLESQIFGIPRLSPFRSDYFSNRSFDNSKFVLNTPSSYLLPSFKDGSIRPPSPSSSSSISPGSLRLTSLPQQQQSSSLSSSSSASSAAGSTPASTIPSGILPSLDASRSAHPLDASTYGTAYPLIQPYAGDPLLMKNMLGLFPPFMFPPDLSLMAKMGRGALPFTQSLLAASMNRPGLFNGLDG